VLVWDLTGRLNADRKPPSAADLNACWAQLAREDAEAADQSVRRLAASPVESLPYLKKELVSGTATVAKLVAARTVISLNRNGSWVRPRGQFLGSSISRTAAARI